MSKEFLSNYSEWVVVSLYAVIFLVSLVSMYLFLTKVVRKAQLDGSTKVSNNNGSVKQPTVAESKILKDSKYSQKKASRHTKDVNRYGRWSLTLKSDNSTITRVGFLYTVLNNVPPVKFYREIK